MKWFILVVLCGLAAANPTPRMSMTELSERSEEFRVLFDELHLEKDDFVNVTRILTRYELRLLNSASQRFIAGSWSTIVHHFDDTRAAIEEMLQAGTGNANCLEGLLEEILAEQVRAADEMRACAAFKIDIKEGLADELRNLGNTLQRISTAAAEYTLFTYAGHNSFINPAAHITWLEENYERQRVFWDTTALVEAQADLDEIERNRPALMEEFELCLSHIPEELDDADQDINQRLSSC